MSGRLPALPLAAAAFTAGCIGGALIGGPWTATLLAALVCGRRGRAGAPPARGLDACAAAADRPSSLSRPPAMRGAARPTRAPPPPLASLEGVHEITGVVRSDPRVSGAITRLDLRVESIDGAAAEGGLRLRLPAPLQPLRAGDRVAATLEVERPGAFDEFDYAAFLRSRGIHAVAAYPQHWTLLERNAEPAIIDALRGHAALGARQHRARPAGAGGVAGGGHAARAAAHDAGRARGGSAPHRDNALAGSVRAEHRAAPRDGGGAARHGGREAAGGVDRARAAAGLRHPHGRRAAGGAGGDHGRRDRDRRADRATHARLDLSRLRHPR